MNSPAPSTPGVGPGTDPARGEELAPVGLLHNMSARPTTAVAFRGVHRCRALRVGIAEALKEARIRRGNVARLCRHLGVKPGDGETAGRALAAFLHATALDSSLPEVAPALREPDHVALSPTVARVDDLALALAVAAKSSPSVFVKAKSPLVSQIWDRDLIVLLIPESPSTPARPVVAWSTEQER